MNRNKYLCLIFLLFVFAVNMRAEQAMTKNQLLRMFYQANTYEDAGNDSMAIATLESVAERIPRLPITYLRMAEIYDKMAAGNDLASLNAAVLMYRRYLSMELDDTKTKDASNRLRVLEDKLKVSHFEDEDDKKGELELESRKAIPVAVNDDDVEKICVVTTQKKQQTIVHFNSNNVPSSVPSVVPSSPTQNASAHVKPNISVSPTSVSSSENAISPKKSQSEVVDNGSITTTTTPLDNTSMAVDNAAAVAVDKDSALTFDTEGIFSSSVRDGFDETAVEMQRCDQPLDISSLKISRLEQYDITVTPQSHNSILSQTIMTPESLEGHWVSSLTNAAGRETWILDVSPFGDNCSVTLHSESGVLQSGKLNQSFFNKIVNLLEENEFLSNTTQSIVCDQVEGFLKGPVLTFTFESEKSYKPSSGIYTWSRTLLENLSSLLPFGNMLYKVGDKLLTNQTEKDVEASYSIESRFDCSLVSEGVIECRYSSKEKKQSGGHSKMIRNEFRRFYFYKTNEDYVCFTPLDISMDDDVSCQTLFNQVKLDADKNIQYNYPLAMLYYYGVGTAVSEADAIEVMTQLAKEKQCGRAMTWLATSYFNLAHREDDISTSVRKKYYKSSLYWLNKMSELSLPSYYALKADMDESNNDTDSILQYYKTGAMKGDVYATYKLGLCALNGHYMKKNVMLAQKCMQEACAKKYPDAYLQMALMSKEGIGMAKADTTAYINNLCTAVDLGSADALSELSSAYIRGIGIERNFQTGNLMRDYRFRADNSGWVDILDLYGYDVSKYR